MSVPVMSDMMLWIYLTMWVMMKAKIYCDQI